MSQKFSLALGWIFLFVGLIGFFANGFLGLHLSLAHNSLFLATGFVSLFFGFASSRFAKVWCTAVGLIYTVVSIIGLCCPPGTIAVTSSIEPTGHLLRLIPGALEFATADSLWQLLAGVVFFVAGLKSLSAEPKAHLTEDEESRNLRVI